MTWRLLTIRPSHYNEKARWALDHHELAYEERPLMPMLHFPPVIAALLPRRAGRADRESTRFSTPALLTEDRAITDSGEIVAFADERGDRGRALLGDPEAEELARHFSGRFGADVRLCVYQHILDRDELMNELALRSVGSTQARLFRLGLPAIRKGLRKRLGVEAARAERALGRIEAEFAKVDARLADGRSFLCGDSFSVADLSFAALASLSLLIQPQEGYGAWIPSIEQVGGEGAATARRLRATAAGAFALRMFAEHRGRRQIPCTMGS
ncbi:MAG: glutathione S-transferase [Myxococcales bacterium]|nr:glutathione S-transferase [Myxococcales bacterium]